MWEFKKSFTFENRTHYEKTPKEPSGAVFTTRESVVKDTFIVNCGSVVEIPTWVKESEHFRMVLADGDAVEVPAPIVAEQRKDSPWRSPLLV